MLQLNDTHHTLIDLSKKNLTGINFHSMDDEITVKFKLDNVVVETTFTYESAVEARQDYQMLIDMVSDSPSLLQEGIEAYCEDLENFKLKEKCSVISLADVLEHTPFPKKILDCCNKLLVDNGILFLS